MPLHSAPARLRAASLATVLLAASAMTSRAQSVHCGTSLWMQRNQASLTPSKRSAWAARTAPAAVTPVRVLETANFRIHYVLRGTNRVKLIAEDAAFAALADSLYASLPGTVSGDAADSTVFARLDSRGAGHPRYISGMADILENARGYYVDTLKMKAPRETGPFSVYYQAGVKAGKYPVDVADIGTAEPDFRGQEIYALTYPTGRGGMLMENDFLFNAALAADGSVRGDSISSRYQGRLVHNYAREWDLGLKVTCYHELYHSVQFAYTPNEQRYHLWYETSAVGMEERKAPEVDDYLQYLPAYVRDLSDRGMHAFPDGGLSRYGNGIFHVFLTRELGEDFDVKLWSILVRNGNDIVAGLEELYASHGTTSQEIYARFGAQLAFAGTDAANPLPAFSPDIPLWPKLPRDTVDLSRPGTWISPRPHPPLSITALHLRGEAGGKALIQPDTLLRLVLARLGGDTDTVQILEDATIPLDIPGSGGEAAVMVVNGHQTLRSDPVEVRPLLSRVDDEVYPYPNPHRRVGGGELIFSRLTRPALVTIYTESGAAIRVLAFSTDSKLWTWDLADAQGRKVRPGVYYYRTDGGPLKPFFLK